MKHYYKQCKNIKEVNKYLAKSGIEGFEFDEDIELTSEFDYDGWQNSDNTYGVSVLVTTSYEVFATKYTDKDIAKLEKEIA